jgi:hypothetical protein
MLGTLDPSWSLGVVETFRANRRSGPSKVIKDHPGCRVILGHRGNTATFSMTVVV